MTRKTLELWMQVSCLPAETSPKLLAVRLKVSTAGLLHVGQSGGLMQHIISGCVFEHKLRYIDGTNDILKYNVCTPCPTAMSQTSQ